MRIGIFGGSFNPPHKMHKNMALDLIDKGYLDRVIYVPTGNKYSKNELISADERFNMLKIMTNKYDNLDVSDYEIKSSLTYTYQTLDYFKNEYPNDEIYFICGLDNLKDIVNWREYEYILDTYKLLVVKRGSDDASEIMGNINTKNVIITDVAPFALSSTEIRRKLKENKYDLLCEYVDSEILQYIMDKNIY